jgi:hypothetical protein
MLLLASASILFGFSCKIADLYDEHGMGEPFWGAKYVAGLIWGLAALAIMVLSPSAGISTLALVFYWVLVNKLDHPNHGFGAVIALLGSYPLLGAEAAQHFLLITLCVASYSLAKALRIWSIARFPACRPFWRARPQIYLVSLLAGLVLGNQEPLLTAVLAMIPTEALTIWHKRKQSQVASSSKASPYLA